MNKKSLIITLVISTFMLLTWCSTTEKVGESKNLSSDNQNYVILENDIFERNLKCQEYLDFYRKNFYEAYLDDSSERIWKPEWITLRDTWNYKIYSNPKIFYSPVTNSCIWTFWLVELRYDDNWNESFWYTLMINSIDWYEYAKFTTTSYRPFNCFYGFDNYKEIWEWNLEKYCEVHNDRVEDNNEIQQGWLEAVEYFRWKKNI